MLSASHESSLGQPAADLIVRAHMTISRKAAIELIAKLDEASMLCTDSLKVVRTHEALGTVQVYGRLAGFFLSDSYTNILAYLWKEYPDLEPASMRVPYEEPIASLTTESQAAISAFAVCANEAISKAYEIMGVGERTSAMVLPFGGIPEVEKSIAAVEDFLVNPRYKDEESPLANAP